jgi:hypothetical protein
MMNMTYITVKNLSRRVDGVDYKVYTDNFASFADLLDNLKTTTVNWFGTLRRNLRGCQGIIKCSWATSCQLVKRRKIHRYKYRLCPHP